MVFKGLVTVSTFLNELTLAVESFRTSVGDASFKVAKYFFSPFHESFSKRFNFFNFRACHIVCELYKNSPCLFISFYSIKPVDTFLNVQN